MKGFTVVELMIIIAISAILATIAAPSFSNLIANNRTTALTNNVVAAFNLARSEAIKRGQPVSLCPSATGATCGGTWPQGWILFVDDNGDGVMNTGTDQILRVWQAVNGNPNINTAAVNVRFDGMGRSMDAVAMTIAFPGCSGEQARVLTVNQGGRISVTRIPCP